MTAALLGILIGLAIHFLHRTAANTAAIHHHLTQENNHHDTDA